MTLRWAGRQRGRQRGLDCRSAGLVYTHAQARAPAGGRSKHAGDTWRGATQPDALSQLQQCSGLQSSQAWPDRGSQTSAHGSTRFMRLPRCGDAAAATAAAHIPPCSMRVQGVYMGALRKGALVITCNGSALGIIKARGWVGLYTGSRRRLGAATLANAARSRPPGGWLPHGARGRPRRPPTARSRLTACA